MIDRIIFHPLGDDPPQARLLYGQDVRESLKLLPDASVHTVCTSPPYWGLRSYGGEPTIWGGDEGCDHQWGDAITVKGQSGGTTASTLGAASGGNAISPEGIQRTLERSQTEPTSSVFCTTCGAWRGQLGLEPSPELFAQHLVEVFREVKRVLRDDGTLWMNLGDTYFGGGGGNYGRSKSTSTHSQHLTNVRNRIEVPGIKPKDLVGIPWMVAFALRADGWYLRSDIIWAKANPMPSSVTDRPTKAHEYIFLLAKGQWSTRTVKFTNLQPEFFKLGRNIGAQNTAVGATRLCVRLASTIFDFAQEQSNFRLPPFYAEVWKQCPDDSNSHLVADLPPEQLAAAYGAARFLDGHTSTKEFLNQIDGLWRDLTEGDHFLKCRGDTQGSLTLSILVDSNGAVTVNDTGEISEIDFLHHQVIVRTPTTCKYFYDADAIREPHKADSEARMYRGRSENHKWVNGPGGQSLNTHEGLERGCSPGGRNKRTVWNVNGEPDLVQFRKDLTTDERRYVVDELIRRGLL